MAYVAKILLQANIELLTFPENRESSVSSSVVVAALQLLGESRYDFLAV